MASSEVLMSIAAVFAALSLYLVLRIIVASRLKFPLPPGPKPLPVLGNLFDIPFAHEYKTYTEWGRKYGDVVHVSALGKRIVILNSIEAATDLLDKRSAIYSDRPFIPMLHDQTLMDANWAFAFARYSPQWRRHRRLFIHHLGPAASLPEFLDIQKASAYALLRLMLRAPKDFVTHIKYAAAESTLVLTYGYHMQSMDDPLFTIVDYATTLLAEGVLPGRFMVNVFPWMKHLPSWFPGTSFKPFSVKAREATRKNMEVPFEYAKERVDQGTASASFVTSALTQAPPDDLIMDIKQVAATMYAGGAETTASTMHSSILALVLHPEVQKRAHAELDSVLGDVESPSFHLPTFADRPDLPYIDAIVKELLRWLPAAPLGIPHATTEDDVYRGWRIPKGTIVIANAWPMLYNEQIYPVPMKFRPERFLGENPAPHPGLHGCFGFGRRECPGRHLAEVSLWIQIASILSVFKLLPSKDKNGRDIDPSYAQDPTPTLILHPQDFPCMLVPRSKEAEMRVLETHLDQ